MTRILTVVLLASLSFVCLAQEELDDNREVLKRKDANAAMSELVYKRLSAVHEQMGEDQLTEALAGLKKIEKQRLSDYEEALVQQTFGFVFSQQGNETEAISRFERSLELGSLPAAAHQGMLYSLAGLYAAEQQYLKSIETAREWFRYEEAPKADAYMLIGSSFAELERLNDALPYVLKAIAKSEKPRENWYMLALAIHLQNDRFRPAAEMLVKMLQFWPDKPRLWDMLSGCYLELKEDKQALDTMMIAYSNRMITNPSRILGLAQLGMVLEMPFTAATIVDEQLDSGVLEENARNLKFLLQAWVGAHEFDRAVEVIDRLERYSEDGRYFLQAAQIHYETGAWEEVADNAAKALDKGIEKPTTALMLQGTAYAELGRFGDAIVVFERVRSTGSSQQRQNAESWIAFVEDKRQMQAAVLDGGR